MKFQSTRGGGQPVTVSEAIQNGLAPDGGLYIPTTLPSMDPGDFKGLDGDAEIARRLLEPFFKGDRLAGALTEICEDTCGFDVPLREVDDQTRVLELFWGPTAAFKDVGAAFLASSMQRLEEGAEQPLTILVATSGDTGAAVAAAFDGRPGCEVVVLYPAGRVSDRQEALLTCWGDNVASFRVRGDFDDCQRIVKEAFSDPWWRENRRLSSANSINIGRLLPQMTYYASASLRLWRESGEAPDFVVPTGNAGNVLACLYVREMGLPVGRVVLATNENRPIPHYLKTGAWQAFETKKTLATAMDVGNPSNFERILHHWQDVEELREQIEVFQVTDEEIRRTIEEGPRRWGQIWDPHTACAVVAREKIDSSKAVVVATAHPAKFPEVVEPLIGSEVPVPAPMKEMMERPRKVQEIGPSLGELTELVG